MRTLPLMCAVGGLLCACSAAPTRTAPVATPSPTRSPARPTSALSATSSPQPTPRTCLSRAGTFVSGELIDSDLPRSVPYRVYFPPCYDEMPDHPLPILLMLHGLLATDEQWQDLGIGDAADRLIRAGEAPPFLIVLPWERKGLDYESALVDHLLPYIQKTYRGSLERDQIAIGGLSRGGGWALRIGLKHPDVFAAVGLHSPAVLSPDLYYLRDWIGDLAPDDRPRIWIDIGDHDSLRTSVFELTDLLDELGVAYTRTLAPGDHLPEYWSAHLDDYLRWYSQSW